MPKTEVRSAQIKDATVGRSDINSTTAGEAVVKKIVSGTGISLSSTGADTGTGDVTITASGGGAPAAHQASHQVGGADALANAAWTNQANAFTKTFAIGIANHALSLQSALPLMSFLETGAVANSKLWRLYANAAKFVIQPTNDDDSSATGSVVISRTGGLTVSGSDGNVACKDQANTFTQKQTIPDLLISHANNPRLAWRDDSQGVDAKVFEARNQIGSLHISAVNDSQTAVVSNPLRLDRTGDMYIGRDVYEKGRTTPMGHWINVPFSALNFVASGGMVWTVTSGNVNANRYALVGKTLFWNLQISVSTLSGSPSSNLNVVLPGGLLAACDGNSFGREHNAGWRINVVDWGTGASYVSIGHIDFSNYTVPESILYAFFTVVIEVQ